MDHFTHKALSRIFTLFPKERKRKIRNPIKKKTEPTNKVCPPKHISFSLQFFFFFASIARFFRSNIQKLIAKMQQLNLSISHPVAPQQYLSYMNETLTLNRRFFAGTDTVAAVVLWKGSREQRDSRGEKQGGMRGRCIEREGWEIKRGGEKEQREQLKDDRSPVSNSASPVKSMRPT